MNVRIDHDAWPDDREGVISNWLYADGDQVAAGALIAEIMVAKTTIELTAPGTGRLDIMVPERQTIVPGQIVACIRP